MRIPIIVPKFDVGEDPIRLGEWAVDAGETVVDGECLTEYILPGLVVDAPAPATGVLVELLRQPEQQVRAGEIIGWIEVTSDESSQTDS